MAPSRKSMHSMAFTEEDELEFEKDNLNNSDKENDKEYERKQTGETIMR